MIQNNEKGGLRRRYYSFPKGTDIRTGDIVRIDGARDLWHIIDVEDHVVSGAFVEIKAIYEKFQESPAKKPAPTPMNIVRLHPEVQRIAGPLVTNGHYRQAIADTFIALDEYVETKSGIKDTGAALMQRVFTPNGPILEVSQEKEEQSGFMMLFTGAMKAIRNQYAHSLVDPKTPAEALEWLGFASALFRLVDGATKRP